MDSRSRSMSSHEAQGKRVLAMHPSEIVSKNMSLDLYRSIILIVVALMSFASIHAHGDEVTAAVGKKSSGDAAMITSVNLHNVGLANLSESPATFGQVFKPGDVPRGRSVTGRLASGKILPLQVDGKAMHPDGSLRHAVISMIGPALAAGKSLSIDLVKAAGADAGDQDSKINHEAPQKLAAEVVLTIEGKRYIAALPGNRNTRWLAGALVNEVLFAERLKDDAGAVHPHLMLRGGLRVYRNNAAWLDLTLENGWAYASGPSDYRYDVAVEFGGKRVYQKLGLVHYHLSRWRKVFWSGAEPKIMVSRDPRYLIATRAVPAYDLRVRIAKATLDRYRKKLASADVEPMGKGLTMPGMRTTGGRPEIGPLPDWAAAQIISQDAAAWAATLVMGDLSGSWPIHYRDQQTDLPVTIDDYPYMTLQGEPRDAINKRTGKSEWFPDCEGRCKTPFTPDAAHQPSFAFLPYLLTGDYYYLEELLFWANWNVLQLAPAYRSFEKGLLKPGQIRAQAWSLRTLAQAAYIMPDQHSLKSYFVNMLQANLAWYNQQYSNNPDANKLGILSGTSALVSPDGLGIQPWQDDFFTWAAGYTAALGFEEARPLLNWKAKFIVGRMIDPGFCWIFASEYFLSVRASKQNNVLFENLKQAYQASIANRVNSKGIRLGDLKCGGQEMADWRSASFADNKQSRAPAGVAEMVGYASSPEGFPAIMQPALAAAVDGEAPGAAAAWQRFTARQPLTDFSAEPQFAIVPMQLLNN